jgi:hypothetical protein
MNRVLFSVVLLTAALIDGRASAQTFSVQIGSPVGTASCGNVNTGASSTPVARDLACSSPTVPGGMDAQAAALFGFVGGTTGATVGAGYVGSAYGINTNSQFTDFVTFTSSDPSATTALIAANLGFSGTMNATDYAGASIDLFYSLYGPGYIFSASDNGVARNDFIVALGSVTGADIDALLQTNMILVPLNQPLLMTLGLATGAGVGGSGSPESARSDFSNSFEVPFGIDAFVVPFGVTANAGNWLVDNRRINLNDPAVPEPATWAMMIVGFGMSGFVLRRRKRRIAEGLA